MKVGRRLAALVVATVVLVLALTAARATTTARAAAKATTITIWADKDRKPAVEKVAGQWASRRGVQVDVVLKNFEKIRDDLKTVQAESAPDVVVGAHDWTGQLAADGLILPLFPKKSVKKQIPKYALDGFSYGRLYGMPVAVENVGLVVNTRLAKVPKTFAR